MMLLFCKLLHTYIHAPRTMHVLNERVYARSRTHYTMWVCIQCLCYHRRKKYLDIMREKEVHETMYINHHYRLHRRIESALIYNTVTVFLASVFGIQWFSSSISQILFPFYQHSFFVIVAAVLVVSFLFTKLFFFLVVIFFIFLYLLQFPRDMFIQVYFQVIRILLVVNGVVFVAVAKNGNQFVVVAHHVYEHKICKWLHMHVIFMLRIGAYTYLHL